MKRFKINFKQIYFLLFAIIFSVWALMVMYSCSDSRQAQKGFDKFTKNGGKVKCDTTYIDVPRIVKGKDGKDSLIYVKEPCNCPDVDIPPSRLETRLKYRFDHKRFNDSLKFVKAFYRDSFLYALRMAKIDLRLTKEDNKHTIKQAKIEKRHGWLNVLIVAIVLSLLIWWLLRNNKLKRYDTL